MKKSESWYILLVLIVVAMIVLVTGCNKEPVKGNYPNSSTNIEDEIDLKKVDESDAQFSEMETGLHFKTGTWATSYGINYVFYENGKEGKTINVNTGVGIGFEYELDADGNGIFHIGSADDMTKVTVEFIDSDNNTAAINWEDGSRVVLMFVSEDISDDFSYSYKMGQITNE